MADTLVLGLGNDFAGDDAVGVLVARALLLELEGVADVVESAASGLGLLEILASYDRAVVVDSVVTGRAAPGTVVELGLDEIGEVVAPSVHHTGLPELAAVAARLGLGFPSTTRVLAVEVVDPYTLGVGLSEPVARALEEVVARVRAMVRSWEEGAGCTTTTRSRPSSVG